MTNEEEITQIEQLSHRLESDNDLDDLINAIGERKLVLLGESTHGTSEYYTWRARISKRLIAEKGFNFIAVEGDWPDCFRVNRYIKHHQLAAKSALDVLYEFNRWPTWMWANWEMVALVEWLRKFNTDRSVKTGFYGMDVYSLWESLSALSDYLEKSRPELVDKMYEIYHCFQPYEDELDTTPANFTTCEDEILQLLGELRAKVTYEDEDDLSAEKNALVLKNAETYYRIMLRSDSESWNVRDRHMTETIDNLLSYYGKDAKGIVWAHNTHIGDARATNMTDSGMVNIGQLLREKFGPRNVFIIGLTGYVGETIAAKNWGDKLEQMTVPEATIDSWEGMLNEAGSYNKYIIMDPKIAELRERRGNRAIGVVYRPRLERYGNYVPTILSARYDAVVFLPKITALHPLHIKPISDHEPPETYPWGV